MVFLAALSALLLQVVVAQNATDVCDDVDTQACKLLVTAKPDYCKDADLSKPTCARFCGYCPVVCYHCDVSVSDYRDCNTTKACALTETCMIKQLRSTADGHHEYIMSCEDKQVCDGPGLSFPFGRREVESRDVSVHCCSGDLCNYPTDATTTGAVTTAIPITGCSRDIAFMIDTSARSRLPIFGSHGATSALTSSLQLMRDIVSQLNIGPYDNLVSLATFDRSVHKQWDLDDHLNKNAVLQAIATVHPRIQYAPHGDINEAVEYLTNHVLDDDHGDRDHFPDDVIIITDASSEFHSTLLKQKLQRKSRDVIVVSVGHATSTGSTAGGLATDAAHKIQVASYADLSSIGGRIFQLLCS